MDLAIDAAWSAGLLLSILRVAAFVVASPLFPSSIPIVGRIGLALALGMFFAEPLTGSLDAGRLLGAGVINATIGLTLGYLTALVFAMFPVAGGIVDMTSGLGAAALIDPNMNTQAAIFNRLFTLTALVVFVVIGGDHLLVHGLALSMQTIPLDGSITLAAADGSAFAIEASKRMLIAGAELALPAVAALFLAEVVLGLASRFAPQANVFLLGLPLRILITLLTGSLMLSLFPSATSAMIRSLREAFVAGLRMLGAT